MSNILAIKNLYFITGVAIGVAPLAHSFLVSLLYIGVACLGLYASKYIIKFASNIKLSN